MVLKLVGAPKATCTRRVAAILHEKRVPFEVVPVNMAAGEHKSPAYLEKHPFGVVPYIDDDGFILFESRAIGRYIAAKYANQGTPLLPDQSDLKAWALFEQAASIEYATFDPAGGGAVIEKIIKPFKGIPTNEAVFEERINLLEKKFEGYEAILGKQKYLAGDKITLADIFHIPFLAALPATGRNVTEKFPNVKRWADDIISRPAWQVVKDGAFSVASYE